MSPVNMVLGIAAGAMVVVYLAQSAGLLPSPAPAAATPFVDPPVKDCNCSPDWPTRTHEGGGVKVSLTYANHHEGRAAPPRFEVVMDTMSVDLGGYDLAALASLEDGRGNRTSPARWELKEAGHMGHHVRGNLTFSSPAALPFNVTLRGIAGVDSRAFRWEAG